MLLAKYTSSKEVINNFYRNTAYTEHVNLGDMSFWIYECMGLIDAPLQYIPKIIGHIKDSTYELTTYRVELPCDFHKLIAVAVDGNIAIPSSGAFHHLMDGACCGFSSDTSAPDLFYDNFGNVFSPQALPLSSRLIEGDPTFTLNNNYITFDRKEGKVCMAYWALPLDEEGYPLIPDDIKYKRACSSYLQYKIDYIIWRQDMLTDKVFAKSEQDWLWNISSASSHIKMPDVNQMEAFRRQNTKMIIRTEEFRNGFATLQSSGYRGRY